MIGLVETQINPVALQSKSIVVDNLFQAESNFCTFNNNSNKIIGPRQQGGILTSIWGECANLIHSTGSDPTKLERWNWIDLIHNQMKIRIITAYRCLKSC